jgi:hypothetical protein
MKTAFIGRVSALGLGLGALLVAAPVRAGHCPEGTTAAEAQAKVDKYDKLADHYRGMGGVAQKAGLIRQAERSAAKYEACVSESCPPAEETMATLPAATAPAPFWATTPWWTAESEPSTATAPEPSATTGTNESQPTVACKASKPAVQTIACRH